jgi:hypothetical protein
MRLCSKNPSTGNHSLEQRAVVHCSTANAEDRREPAMKYLMTTLIVASVTTALAQGQTPVPTPSNPGASIQEQERNRNNGPYYAPTQSTPNKEPQAKQQERQQQQNQQQRQQQ